MKDYIRYIRSYVGHGEVLSVGVAAVILNTQGEVLLEKRSDTGELCLPGGGLDLGETALEGLKREVKEETNLDIGEARLLFVRSGEKEKYVYPNGDVTYYLDLFFLTETQDASALKINDGESKELKFYPLGELMKKDAKEFMRGTKEVLEKVYRKDFSVQVD